MCMIAADAPCRARAVTRMPGVLPKENIVVEDVIARSPTSSGKCLVLQRSARKPAIADVGCKFRRKNFQREWILLSQK